MRRGIRLALSTLVSIGLITPVLFGQHVGSVYGAQAFGTSTAVFLFSPSFNPYFYPTFGSYGGYFPSAPSPAYSYLPNYWWTGHYNEADPRQNGYNPSAGYPRETVETLLLVTLPEKARVTLDGVYVGTADSLGPTQLPMGEHSVRVEAPLYEPSETILKVEQPGVQQLDVRLIQVAHTAKPAPRE